MTEKHSTDSQQTESLDFYLVVIQPFGDYQRGAIISDTKTIKTVLVGDNAHFCNKVKR
jgi:transcription termination factor Rho